MTETPAPTQSAALAARLRAAARAFCANAPAVEAGAPWPLADHFGVEPEASWGPPETLAHVAEMVLFWNGEMERVVAGGSAGTVVPFGRVASNELRIGIIERDRTLPPRELFDRIEAGAERLARRLERLTPNEETRRGVHPTLGEASLPEIAERFVVAHLEDHTDQLEAALIAAR